MKRRKAKKTGKGARRRFGLDWSGGFFFFFAFSMLCLGLKSGLFGCVYWGWSSGGLMVVSCLVFEWDFLVPFASSGCLL